MLSGTYNGRLFLELESVMQKRHTFNPLALHESSKVDVQAERESLIDLLLLRSATGSDDMEEILSETELEEVEGSPFGGAGMASAASVSAATKPTISCRSATAGASSSLQKVPLKKTAPASRPIRLNLTVTNDVEAPANNEKDRRLRPHEVVSKVLGDSFGEHLTQMKERTIEMKERNLKKDALEEERFQMEKAKAVQEEERMRLENQKNQLVLTDHFIKMVQDPRDLDLGAVGTVVFGVINCINVKDSMLALAADIRAKSKGSTADNNSTR